MGRAGDYKLALPQALDSVRYLAEMHGQDTLLDLLNARRNSLDLDTALQSVRGLSTLEFDSTREESFASGHLYPAGRIIVAVLMMFAH